PGGEQRFENHHQRASLRRHSEPDVRIVNTQVAEGAESQIVTQPALALLPWGNVLGALIPGFALYGFLAYRALQGRMTVGDLVMFYQAVQRGQGYISQLLGSIALLYENNLFLTNIHEFLAFQPQVTDPQRPKSLTGAVREGIAFHDVKFRYPKSERTV